MPPRSPDQRRTPRRGGTDPSLDPTVTPLRGAGRGEARPTRGGLADARSEGLYEAAELTQLLGSVVVPLEKVEKQLDKVAKLKLEAMGIKIDRLTPEQEEYLAGWSEGT